MTQKTYTVTLKENAKFASSYTNSDVDFYVGSNIIASDLNHHDVRAGDVVRAVTHDFDFTSNVVLKMVASATTERNTTVVGELYVTMAPQGGNNFNITCLNKEESSGADETYFDEKITSSAVFKINGVAKHTKDATAIGDNDYGTHAITWNGSDALTFTFELTQTDSNADVEHATTTEFKIS